MEEDTNYSHREGENRDHREGAPNNNERSFSGNNSNNGFRSEHRRPRRTISNHDGDSPRRSYNNEDNDRPRRSYNSDNSDRPRRSYNSDNNDRPRRSYNSDSSDRPRRSYNSDNNDRPRRSYNNDNNDRPRRSYDSDNSDRPRRSYNSDNNDRPRRSYNSDNNDRPRRSYNSDNTDRPRRSYNSDNNDRPRRSYNSDNNDRPRRSYNNDNNDRPRRSYDNDNNDRPRRSYNNEGDDNRNSRGNGRFNDRNRGGQRFNHSSNQRSFNQRPRAKGRMAPTEPDMEQSTASTHAMEGLTRLNKYISNAGVCSRREADNLIAAGAVRVNGEVVTQMGYLVKDGDVVNYGGETLHSEPKRYFLLNKPKDYITTLDDPEERQTVMDLIQGACNERIYPVGRLDRATTGLLLFTNDGDLSKKLTHPSTGVYKVYQVELDRPLEQADMRKMLDGIDLEDGSIAVDDVQYANDGDNQCIVGVQLHSGRNRIVRRIFEYLGYSVEKLDRTVFAGLTKKDLPRGHYRELTQREISFLKMV